MAPSPATSEQAEPPVNPDEIASLMPLLVPLPEQKQLAAELRALLESGNSAGASQKLTAAVEVGALASILLDWISYPALLSALRALPDQSVELQTAVAGAETTALTEALDGERMRAAALSKDLDAIRTEFAALKTSREQESASASAISEDLRDALKEQEERAEAATRELANVAQELAVLKSERDKQGASATADSNNLAQALKDQEVRATRSAQELAKLTQELAILKTEREREATALAADKAALVTALKREEERAGASDRDLKTLTQQIATLRQTRDRESASASAEIANLQRALTSEKARGDDAARQAVKLAEDLHASQKVKAAPRILSLTPTMSDAGSFAAQQIPDAPPAVLATGAIVPVAGTERPTATDGAPLASPAASRPAAAPAAEERLTARADQLFRSGDVSAARLLLERAQDGGNAQAIFLLAETFDPNALATIGAVGMRSDPGRARELYSKALGLGIERARPRIEALK